MRQKTLIAATVLAAAPVLLFDEPMIGLDPRGQRELRDAMTSLARDGTSLVVSTHQMDLAETICDRVIILKRGAVVAEGVVSDLRQRLPAGGSFEDAFLDITG